MTWLARLSLTNRAIVGLVTVLVIGFGLVSTASLRQELFPSLDVPVVSVVTPYPGSSPDAVEQQVSVPVEQAVESLAGVTATRSRAPVAARSSRSTWSTAPTSPSSRRRPSGPCRARGCPPT